MFGASVQHVDAALSNYCGRHNLDVSSLFLCIPALSLTFSTPQMRARDEMGQEYDQH